MTGVTIKPLRTYEDRGEIRKRGGEAYTAPSSLAKELEARGLCEIVEDSEPTEEKAGKKTTAKPKE
ncbi:hypothetical protein [Pseudomonas typographi]|uniref:hypothetical protein n=1 Tax=Pseudomonas typographi TaxID=2715964 RepID=UPI0016895E15|nr:hypothetical protein [Pseudomonas typographi]MBD1553629.1 hypothetical protein [Pseudomonas typographi]